MTQFSRRTSPRGAAIAVAVALGGLTLAAPSAAKSPEAAFKLLSVSGTQTHTFAEDGTVGGTRPERCVGTQSLSVRYHSTKPVKMYVFLREAHGLHTLISDKPDPDSGLDYLSVPGEMTVSRSVNYEAAEGCEPAPVDCPETTFPAPVLVFGTHDPSGGISPLYDTNLDLPSGLDESCAPEPGARYGPLSPGAEPPDQVVIPGAIPRSELFNKKRKRLSGKDSEEFSYQTMREPGFTNQTTVTGTYGETIAVELKRLIKKN